MKRISLMLLLAGWIQTSFLTGAQAGILENWTTNQITTNSFAMDHIVYGTGRYVATAEYWDSGAIYSSDDGTNWVLRYSGSGPWGLTMNYVAGYFLGLGGYGSMAVSTNGTNWTISFLSSTLHDPGGFNSFGDITYGNGMYVVVGSTNSVGNIITSTDGSTWTSHPLSPNPGGPIASVVCTPADGLGFYKFVAVGNNDGWEYYSTIGTGTWSRRAIPGGSQISYGNGLFIVPLTSKTNLMSTDGINWTLQSTGLTNLLGRVIYANGLFLARSGNYLATSSDGTNWFQYPQPLPGGVASEPSIATDGTRIVTIGNGNRTSYSGDGYVFLSDPLVHVCMTNNPSPKIALSGLVGRNYQIQSADSLAGGSKSWRTNATLQLTNTPCVWTDSTATNSARFYRGVLLP